MSNRRKICTFYLDHYFFGIEVSRVQEVIRQHEMTTVPLAHETIRGLINLRGQIVTAIDMRQRLHYSPMPEYQQSTNIIVHTDDGAVSLCVDDIGDVIEVANDAFEAPPENLQGEISRALKEICKYEGKILLILDVDQLLILN